MTPGLQEWIHKIEEGEGAKYLKMIALVLGLAALAFVYNIRELPLFSRPEAMDAAQLGRNIAQGEGYTTKFVRPLSVALIEATRGPNQGALKENHPDLANPPVYPALLAAWMKVVPLKWETVGGREFDGYQPELMITILNQIILFVCLWLTFLLGRKLFEPVVGGVAALILGLAEIIWRFSSSGLSTMLLMFFLLALVWSLLKIEEKGRAEEGTPKGSMILWALLAGLILGLGCLTRYSFGWLVIPVVAWLLVFAAGKRAITVIAVIAVFAAMATPWVIRNYQLSRTLFGVTGFAIHQGTSVYRGNYLERSMPTNVKHELNQIPLALYVRKGVTNLGHIIKDDLPKLGGSWITGLFLAGLLVPYRNPAISRLRWLLLGILMTFAIAQALGKTPLTENAGNIHGENLLVLATPLVFLMGVAFFFLLIDQVDFPAPQLRSASILGLIVVASLPMIFLLLPPKDHPVQNPPYYPPVIQESASWMGKDDLMMSDMPWAVAWYGNRQCIWTTLDTGGGGGSDFYRINDFQKPVKALYLTRLTTDSRFVSEILEGQEGAWGRFMLKAYMEKSVPEGFPLRAAPSGFLPEQMFLSDRPRWRANEK